MVLHPESDGQTERVNQCLELAFKEPKKWAEWLPAAEWWYNTSYHTSLKTTPFEALYQYPPPPVQQIAVPCNADPDVQITQDPKKPLNQAPKNQSNQETQGR